MNVHFCACAAANKGDDFAIGRPSGVGIVVGVARDVDRWLGPVGGHDPDIAIEVVILRGINNKSSIGRPVEIGGGVRLQVDLFVGAVWLDGNEFPPAADKGDA